MCGCNGGNRIAPSVQRMAPQIPAHRGGTNLNTQVKTQNLENLIKAIQTEKNPTKKR